MNNIDTGTGALMNTLVGQATNVEIQVTKSDKTVINLNNPSAIASPVIANGTTTIPFGAQYLATGATTAGEVQSSLMYEVSYN